jgi:hypothetical protein
VSVQISVKRHATWSIIVQVLAGGVFAFAGAVSDNLELLVIGVWLMLQGQIHQMWDELAAKP